MEQTGTHLVDRGHAGLIAQWVALGTGLMTHAVGAGFGILQEGQAVAVAKNVKVRPNEFDCPISYGAVLFTPGLSLFPAYLPLL